MHKILLNSVLLSPIVSGGGRPNPNGHTPLGHNPPCFLPFVGRLGSGPRLVGRIGSGVRVSVSFQQKFPLCSVLRCPTAAEYEVMTKGVVSGGLTSVSGVQRRARHKHFVVVLCEQRTTLLWTLLGSSQRWFWCRIQILPQTSPWSHRPFWESTYDPSPPVWKISSPSASAQQTICLAAAAGGPAFYRIDDILVAFNEVCNTLRFPGYEMMKLVRWLLRMVLRWVRFDSEAQLLHS